jgi:oligopeptidase B
VTVLKESGSIFQSDDSEVMVDMQRTKGCQYLAIQALTKTSNEVHLCRHPDNPLILVRPRQEGILYHLDVGVDQDVVMLTSNDNDEGNYKVLETSIASLPLKKDGNDSRASAVISAEDCNTNEFFIEDMDLFQDYLVLYQRSKKTGLQRLCVQERNNSEPNPSTVDLSETGSVPWTQLTPAGNIWYQASFLRFELESPFLQGCVHEYDFETGRVERKSNASSVDFHREIVFVQSDDGTKIPMSLFYDSNTVASSEDLANAPVVLVGYGAYGQSADLGYNPSWLSLLKRGAVLAFAHTRGGGDLGKQWYDAGRRENKVRSVEDFEACAKYLKLRFKERPLAAKAFSAGGVLVGATVNRCPGLLDKVVMTNAFLDVNATMRNSSLFLTEHEFAEFGNPNEEDTFREIIRSYCPVFNLKSDVQADTNTSFLLIGTLDDRNVPLWNTTLYYKKLSRSFQAKGKKNAFMHVLPEGGHDLVGMRPQVSSLETAFLLTNHK